MNRLNCHSERSRGPRHAPILRVLGWWSGRELCPRSCSRPRGHEVEESLFATITESFHSEERVAHSALRAVGARRGICFSLFVLLLTAVPLFAQAPVQTTDRARTIGKQLMCTCGCGDTAGSCSHPGAAFSGPCEVAKAKLKEVDERISRGESDQSILLAFVQEYGEAALAAPPARGLNWFAYTFPAVAFAIGLGLVIMIIRVWHRPQVATASGPAVSPEMLEHVRRQIEHDVQQDD
jgi:cytochrome c-type biogenesis protein CcmH/NrfF